MSILGKIHEVSFYGLCTTITCLCMNYVTMEKLWFSAFHPEGFQNIFLCYLFWASALFIPIAIIGAFYTKYEDDGEGLSFSSDNIFVIIFAHIAEEILGLFLTPFWFLIDFFTKRLTGEKALDYILYLVEIIFVAAGLFFMLTR